MTAPDRLRSLLQSGRSRFSIADVLEHNNLILRGGLVSNERRIFLQIGKAHRGATTLDEDECALIRSDAEQ